MRLSFRIFWPWYCRWPAIACRCCVEVTHSPSQVPVAARSLLELKCQSTTCRPRTFDLSKVSGMWYFTYVTLPCSKFEETVWPTVHQLRRISCPGSGERDLRPLVSRSYANCTFSIHYRELYTRTTNLTLLCISFLSYKRRWHVIYSRAVKSTLIFDLLL